MTLKKLSLTMVLALASVHLFAQSGLVERIKNLKSVTEVDTLKSSQFGEKYLVRFNHPLDYTNPAVGQFSQRVIVSHKGYDRPTVIVTEGYWADYAMNPNYTEELSKLLDANLIVVEYRYFSESTPKLCDWHYLTVKNSLDDLHDIVMKFKQIYKGKWISTGISKGGQTTMFYRSYYPNDVDISVPYVAPLNKALEDGRHEKFLASVGTDAQRQRITELQCNILKRRARLLPMFKAYCESKGYTFNLPLDQMFDYCVLEISFSVWQWGEDVETLPRTTASDEELFNYLIKEIEPNYFSKQTKFTSFNVQAARELGYYGYDLTPFKKLLKIKSAKGYLPRTMLPDSIAKKDYMQFDVTLYNHVCDFLKNNDPKILYIYGGNDPWSASGVFNNETDFFAGKKNMKVFVQPGGSHRTRISTMPEKMRVQIMSQIWSWLNQ